MRDCWRVRWRVCWPLGALSGTLCGIPNIRCVIVRVFVGVFVDLLALSRGLLYGIPNIRRVIVGAFVGVVVGILALSRRPRQSRYTAPRRFRTHAGAGVGVFAGVLAPLQRLLAAFGCLSASLGRSVLLPAASRQEND